jgi:hypothetical protein
MRHRDHSVVVATGAAVLQGVATGSSPATNGVRTLKKKNLAASPFVLHAATPSRFSSPFAAAVVKRAESLDAPPSSLRAGGSLCSMHSRAVGASQSPLNPQQEQTLFDRQYHTSQSGNLRAHAHRVIFQRVLQLHGIVRADSPTVGDQPLDDERAPAKPTSSQSRYTTIFTSITCAP